MILRDDELLRILQKYDTYFEPAEEVLHGLVYFIRLVESRYLEAEVQVGKIIATKPSRYIVRFGVETLGIRKHLCFRTMAAAQTFCRAILIDELRLIV